eukprot:CCRYP_014525-RA/>CCRYP_014525-RA protein AED:0.36 eAED:0.36 QI:0/-1/0/1/-1/1/1/0/320
MPSHHINIAAQAKNYHELAIHVNNALNNCNNALIETADIYTGRTAAYWAIQKGSPECLGVMAKAGANLHRACPHVWVVEDPTGYHDGCTVDPSAEDTKLSVHHSLNQTALSFVTRTCCECSKNQHLKSCSRCKLARYCSEECQKKNWDLHMLVCKRIQKGADLVTVHKRIPEPAKSDPGGFQPFDDSTDNNMEDIELDKRSIGAYWEYYDISSRTWVAYPKRINWALETIRMKDISPRYVFRPGCPMAEGVEEMPKTCNPPGDVSTHSICFSHMIDHQIYTGAGRKVRRRELDIVKAEPEERAEPEQPQTSCVPFCGALE